MFLVKDSTIAREHRIKELVTEEPAWAVILSVINFEWTIRRAIIAMGTSPNVEIRAKFKRHSGGCDKYKDLWKEEVFPNIELRLPEVVTNWDGLRRAFRLRHRLVHGVGSCGVDHAQERMIWAINATVDVRKVCEARGINLDSRLPVRRKIKTALS